MGNKISVIFREGKGILFGREITLSNVVHSVRVNFGRIEKVSLRRKMDRPLGDEREKMKDLG